MTLTATSRGSIVIDASTVNVLAPGDYTVTYDVSDAAGNAADTVTRTVTVRPPVPQKPETCVGRGCRSRS